MSENSTQNQNLSKFQKPNFFFIFIDARKHLTMLLICSNRLYESRDQSARERSLFNDGLYFFNPIRVSVLLMAAIDYILFPGLFFLIFSYFCSFMLIWGFGVGVLYRVFGVGVFIWRGLGSAVVWGPGKKWYLQSIKTASTLVWGLRFYRYHAPNPVLIPVTQRAITWE